MSEAGIHPGWHGDLYASLGEKLLDGAWSARLQVKPFIRFIWGGAVVNGHWRVGRRHWTAPATKRRTGVKRFCRF